MVFPRSSPLGFTDGFVRPWSFFACVPLPSYVCLGQLLLVIALVSCEYCLVFGVYSSLFV